MFNDYFWISHRTDAQYRRFETWKHSLSPSTPLVVVEIGAGLAVPTVRYLSEDTSRIHKNCSLIRINPRDGDVPRSKDVSIGLGALEALELIDKCLQEIKIG